MRRSLPPRQVEPPRQNGKGRPDPMTPNQRRLLFRLLSDAGHEGEEATQYLCEAAGVENLNDITKARASELIDSWKRAVDA